MAGDIAFLQRSSSNSDLSTYTFSGVSIGAEASDRVIIAAVYSRANASVVEPTLTVAGISASAIVASADGSATPGYQRCTLFAVSVPTGTTGNIVATFSGTQSRCAVDLFRMTGTSVTAYDTATSTSDPSTLDVDVQAGGCIVAASLNYLSGGSSATWSGVTESTDASVESTNTECSSGIGNFGSAATPQSVSVDFTGSTLITSVCASFSVPSGGVAGPVLFHSHYQNMGWR
jgi:hypothetical protein